VSKDLIDWLRAQFDVDERVARAAQDLERDVFDGTGVIVMHAATGTRSVTLSSAVAIHIADHDPARVLREVAAGRELLRIYEEARDYYRRNVQAPAGELTGAADRHQTPRCWVVLRQARVPGGMAPVSEIIRDLGEKMMCPHTSNFTCGLVLPATSIERRP
jgi:hypothetical protein